MRTDEAPAGTGTRSHRSIPAAWVTGMCGPPNGHPLPSVRSSRRPSSRALSDGEAEHVEKLVREIPNVVETGCGVVQRHGVNRLHFDAAHSAGLHGAHLALDLRLGDARSEPPPAHHDAGIVGRVFERPPEGFNIGIGGHGQKGRGGNQNGKTPEGSNHPHTATIAHRAPGVVYRGWFPHPRYKYRSFQSRLGMQAVPSRDHRERSARASRK